jgi:hypothetical protein
VYLCQSASLEVSGWRNGEISLVRTPTEWQTAVLESEVALWTKTIGQQDSALETCARNFIELWHVSWSLTHSWSWALLEKPPNVQLLKNFLAFYGTRRSITVFTRARHWSLSSARSIQSISSHPISLRSILILFNHVSWCRLILLVYSWSPEEFPNIILIMKNSSTGNLNTIHTLQLV